MSGLSEGLTEPEEELRSILGQLHHDMKNPLSIISGNAEYLLELGRAMDLDDEVVTSVEDIEEAARELEKALDEIAELREEL